VKQFHLLTEMQVFRGIGGTAHKYYMLFQHHLPPPPSTYTSGKHPRSGRGGHCIDEPDSVPPASVEEGQGIDPNQNMNVYVHPNMSEPNYIHGPKAGVGYNLSIITLRPSGSQFNSPMFLSIRITSSPGSAPGSPSWASTRAPRYACT
jgi:hypothetical protein